jgi:biotin carboxylase
VTDQPVIMVGYVPVALTSLAEFQPDRTVIVIEEPDVVRKRDVAARMAGVAVARDLISFEYQLAGAADAFYNAHRDLNPAAIAPLQEYATPFAARLAERYGRPGASFGAVQLLRDKSLLRTVTAAAGIRNPVSATVTGPESLRAFLDTHPGKVVLKPANRQAAVGTLILDGTTPAEDAWAACVAMDEGLMVPDRDMPLHMLAETFVEGHEYSVEMLVENGRPVFTNLTDKVLYPGPRPIEAGHVAPAAVPAELRARLAAETARVLAAVGFGTGVVHCEWIVDDGEPCLVECAGRFAGDGIIDLIERAYPVAMVRAFWSLMKGEPVDVPLPAEAERAAAVAFLHAQPGEVQHIAGLDEAQAAPGVVDAHVGVQPGGRVNELLSSWDRPGSVTALGATAEEALRRAQDAADLIQIKVI